MDRDRGGRVEIRETHRLPAPRERVWELLLDPDTVASCFGGTHSVTTVAEDDYRVEVAAHVGPIPLAFDVAVAVKDKEPPDSCTLTVSVGGMGGSAEGSARVRLTEDGDGTLIEVDGEAKAGGLLAGFGGRAAAGAAAGLLREFFDRMRERC